MLSAVAQRKLVRSNHFAAALYLYPALTSRGETALIKATDAKNGDVPYERCDVSDGGPRANAGGFPQTKIPNMDVDKWAGVMADNIEDTGNAALFFASDETGYITGQKIVVDGGQILPESLGSISEI